jgi:hypothetical protein
VIGITFQRVSGCSEGRGLDLCLFKKEGRIKRPQVRGNAPWRYAVAVERVNR